MFIKMRSQEIVLRASEYLLTRCEWFLRREEIRLNGIKSKAGSETIRAKSFIVVPTGGEDIQKFGHEEAVYKDNRF